jgi:hypothetical protein
MNFSYVIDLGNNIYFNVLNGQTSCNLPVSANNKLSLNPTASIKELGESSSTQEPELDYSIMSFNGQPNETVTLTGPFGKDLDSMEITKKNNNEITMKSPLTNETVIIKKDGDGNIQICPSNRADYKTQVMKQQDGKITIDPPYDNNEIVVEKTDEKTTINPPPPLLWGSNEIAYIPQKDGSTKIQLPHLWNECSMMVTGDRLNTQVEADNSLYDYRVSKNGQRTVITLPEYDYEIDITEGVSQDVVRYKNINAQDCSVTIDR